MHHYLDFTLIKDPEFPPDMLRAALLQKLHRALFDLQADDVGMSFPGMDLSQAKFGAVLRLHGSQARLESLRGGDWLRGMRDHLSLSEVAEVPAQTQHRQLLRLRPNSNMERLKRRQLKRHPELAANIEARFAGAKDERVNAPFIMLRSKSTGESFPLLLSLGPLQAQASPGLFNSYGLSGTATVPWF
jgi:CRISPR-associated endonuclease Csy4